MDMDMDMDMRVGTRQVVCGIAAVYRSIAQMFYFLTVIKLQ